MRYILFLVIIFGFIACSKETAIYYEYNETTITRINKGNKILFFYGKFDNENFPEMFVEAEYSGLNSGMQAYLNFLPNKQVEIIGIMGSFEKTGIISNFNIKEIDNIRFIAWKDSIQGNYNNTIELFDVLQIEIERNQQNNSKVKAYHPL
ncbi:MAG: hypothetical protein WAU21_04535 [Chitinophagales bacterium]|nr:hypothetical protein [Bacteroidota bacterium]MBK8488165.1 hypothetical protein [Bacteroidota bacterium]MBK8682091.1 hypothetical protein [Bacteroidota bacterium]